MNNQFNGIWRPGNNPRLFTEYSNSFKTFMNTKRPENKKPILFYLRYGEIKKPRTTGKSWEDGNQNGYIYFLFWWIAIHSRQGLTPKDVKFGYKCKFLVIQDKPMVVTKSLADLSSEEASEFIQWVHADAMENYGLDCPRPEDLEAKQWLDGI